MYMNLLPRHNIDYIYIPINIHIYTVSFFHNAWENINYTYIIHTYICEDTL